MSYNIVFTPELEKEIKRLSRKYPSLKQDFSVLLKDFSVNPKQGQPLGNHCFKDFRLKAKVLVKVEAQG